MHSDGQHALGGVPCGVGEAVLAARESGEKKFAERVAGQGHDGVDRPVRGPRQDVSPLRLVTRFT